MNNNNSYKLVFITKLIILLTVWFYFNLSLSPYHSFVFGLVLIIIFVLIKDIKFTYSPLIAVLTVTVLYFFHLIPVVMSISSNYKIVYLITILLLSLVRLLIATKNTTFKTIYIIPTITAVYAIISSIYPFYGKGNSAIEIIQIICHWSAWIIIEILLLTILFNKKTEFDLQNLKPQKPNLFFISTFIFLTLFQILFVGVTKVELTNGISKDWFYIYHTVCINDQTNVGCECTASEGIEQFCVKTDKVKGANTFTFMIVNDNFAIDKNNIYIINKTSVLSAYNFEFSYIQKTIPFDSKLFKKEGETIEIYDEDKNYQFIWTGKKYEVL